MEKNGSNPKVRLAYPKPEIVGAKGFTPMSKQRRLATSGVNQRIKQISKDMLAGGFKKSSRERPVNS